MVKSLDEVEDLTRFADESFNTDAVDLFEFTGNADSLLTRLKSIILSLDWEITDDILDELAEELAYLRTMWEDDKVAQVYLQGLDKIGKYLQVEGAYAHHNAIKLLLTLFYDYEKIISSPDISGDTITSLLKSDVRKFKVLQYQISMKKGSSVDSADQKIEITAMQENQEPDNNLLANIEATILGLDWEITDEGLEKLNSQTVELGEHLSDNDYAQILLQGLQVIGAYISEKKVNAHPDAYTLLHSFCDGLKILVADKGLDNEKRQEIIIERVNLLNNLKEIIAGTTTTIPVEMSGVDVDHVLDFDSQEQEEKLDTVVDIEFPDKETTDEIVDTTKATGSNDQFDIDLDSDDSKVDQPAVVQDSEEEIGAVASFSGGDEFDIDVQETAAMETASEHYPEEILDPDAIQPLSDEIADEFIEEELSKSSEWQTALDDSDEVGLSFEPKAENTNEENLEEELELLFSDEDELENVVSGDVTADDAELKELSLNFDEEISVQKDSDSRTPNPAESLEDVNQVDVVQSSAGDEEFVTPALAESDEESGFTEDVESAGLGEEPSGELEDKLDSFFGVSDDDDQSSAGDEELVTPALAESDEESGFTEDVESAELGEEPSAELEDKLDSFFNIPEEEPDVDQSPEAAHAEIKDAVEDTVVAALTDADETVEGGFREEEVVTKIGEDPADDLQDKLDSFFGSDHEPETESATDESSVPLDKKLDSFSAGEETSKPEQEVDETIPALADADENSGFDEEEAVVALADSTESAMEDIDGKLDSFFDIDKENSDQTATTPVSTLSSLATAAANLTSSPAANDFQQIADLVAIGKEEYQGTQQAILLTLIDSSVALLGKNNEAAAGSSAIVQELVSGLEDADNPNTIIDAVSRYTSWQQDFFDKSISRQESIDTVTPSPATEISDDNVMLLVQSGFSQLRSTLLNEFESIRKELKKE